jgi:hypothetical protein
MNTKREIRLEDLVGRRVRNASGAVVGKIREVEAEWHGHQCVVTQFHLDGDVRVPASALDLTDPEKLRLR